jgi:hypothetical protein
LNEMLLMPKWMHEMGEECTVLRAKHGGSFIGKLYPRAKCSCLGLRPQMNEEWLDSRSAFDVKWVQWSGSVL